MKRILIISYHFPPLNAIASYRAAAYAQHLRINGFFPTIVTHIWEQDGQGDYKYHDKNTKVLFEKGPEFDTIRIPRVKTRLQVFQEKLSRFKWLSKIFTVLLTLLGHFGVNFLYSYSNFKGFLKTYLQQNRFDLLLGIYSPHYHVRLCYELNKHFRVPYVLDFRDLHDNRVVADDFRPNREERIYIGSVEFYFKKWLKNAKFITATSQIWANKLASMGNISGFQITNGFEKDLFQNIPNNKFQKFTIAHVGTLYPEQNVSIFLEGVKLFLEDKSPEKVALLFIGLKDNNKETVSSINLNIKKDFVTLSRRVERREALNIVKNSHILFYPAWTTTKGVYSGKIFEYLASKNNILICPGNRDVVENLITETSTGDIANTPSEVKRYLEQKYLEWISIGSVMFKGNEERINFYTRENQVRLFSDLLKKHL